MGTKKPEDPQMETSAGAISRRGFLTAATMASVTALVAGSVGCSAPASTGQEESPVNAGNDTPAAPQSATPWLTAPDPIPDSEIVETIDCDIVVCGGGICGLPAAAYAAEQGASVHVLEKGGTWGMHRLCTAGFNSTLQKSLGLTTERKGFVTSTWAITNGSQGRMSSYGRWFDNSGPYIDWLEGVFNAKGYTLVPQASLDYKITNDGVDMPGASELWQAYDQMIFFADADRNFFATGVDVDWTGVLAEYGTEQGVVFHYNTPAVQLVRDEASGRVTSVIAENDLGEYIKLNASKGILLAAGDMAGNKEMMEYYNPSLAKIKRSVAEAKDTGDGQKMGIWIGADMDDFACGDLWPFVGLTPEGVRPESTEVKSYAAIASLPTLMLDKTGRRIAAENLPFQAFSIPKLTATPDGCAWSIWDSAWQSKFPEGGYMIADYVALNTDEQVEKDIAAGMTFKFDTLDEICDFCGFDKDIFNEQFTRYQDFCAKGEDLDFYKDPAWLTPIDTPPYYVSMHGVSITSTRGGLRNDEHCRVLDKDGVPIPGLYAAGNTAGSFYGNVYPPNVMGSGIGHGQCFGWIAVKDILGIPYI
jgi:succinate dehydrogenase/fumarate reductase flavoprotein subunit